jgi:hypothetical protein
MTTIGERYENGVWVQGTPIGQPANSVITGSVGHQGERNGVMPQSEASQAASLPVAYGTVKLPTLQIERFAASTLPCTPWASNSTVYQVGDLVHGSDGSVWRAWRAGMGNVQPSGGQVEPFFPQPPEYGSSPYANWQFISENDALSYPLWAPGATYSVYDRVWSGPLTGGHGDNECYECTTAGTSSSQAGPAGHGASITDNEVVWKWIGSWPQPTYAHTFASAVCEGPVTKITQLWLDTEVLSTPNGTGHLARGIWAGLGGPGQTLPGVFDSTGYPGTACIYSSTFYGGSSKELPAMAVEVQTAATQDLNPADIIAAMLSRSRVGVSWNGSYTADHTAGGYWTYCDQNDLNLSYALTSQTSVLNAIKDLLGLTNSDAVYSNGQLKIVPLDDTATGSFSPSSVAAYDLGSVDFLDVSKPVRHTRRPDEDCYAVWPVSYADRGSGYANVTVEDPYMPGIIDGDGSGQRAGVLSSAAVCPDGKIALRQSRILAQRSMHVRNEFSFRLSWRYALLEPTDIVTITEPGLGLELYPVRVTRVDEAEDGIDVTAEDYPGGISHATAYTPQVGDGYSPQTTKTIASLPSTVNGVGMSVSSHFIGPAHVNHAEGRDNILDNGEFSITSSPFTAGQCEPDSWRATDTGSPDFRSYWNHGVSLETSGVMSGDACIKFSNPDITYDYLRNEAYEITHHTGLGLWSDYTPCSEFRTYRLAFVLKNGTGWLPSIYLEFLNQSKTRISMTTRLGGSGSEVWESSDDSGALYGVFKAPTGACWLRVHVHGSQGSFPITGTPGYIDAVTVTRVQANAVTSGVNASKQLVVSKSLSSTTTATTDLVNISRVDTTSPDFSIDENGLVGMPSGATLGGTMQVLGENGLLFVKRENTNNILAELVPHDCKAFDLTPTPGRIPGVMPDGYLPPATFGTPNPSKSHEVWVTIGQAGTTTDPYMIGVPGRMVFFNHSQWMLGRIFDGEGHCIHVPSNNSCYPFFIDFTEGLIGASGIVEGKVVTGVVHGTGDTAATYIESSALAIADIVAKDSNGIVTIAGSTARSTLRVGQFGVQAFGANNAWWGDNIDFDGAKFVRRYDGAAVWNYALAGEFLVKVAPPGYAGTEIIDGGITAFEVTNAGKARFPQHTAIAYLGTTADGELKAAAAPLTPPTGTGWVHVTGGAVDEAASTPSKSDVGLGNVTNDAQAKAGAATASGLTMATARLLGRTTAAAGAVEEISVGSGLSLTGGSLSCTVAGGMTNPMTAPYSLIRGGTAGVPVALAGNATSPVLFLSSSGNGSAPTAMGWSAVTRLEAGMSQSNTAITSSNRAVDAASLSTTGGASKILATDASGNTVITGVVSVGANGAVSSSFGGQVWASTPSGTAASIGAYQAGRGVAVMGVLAGSSVVRFANANADGTLANALGIDISTNGVPQIAALTASRGLATGPGCELVSLPLPTETQLGSDVTINDNNAYHNCASVTGLVAGTYEFIVNCGIGNGAATAQMFTVILYDATAGAQVGVACVKTIAAGDSDYFGISTLKTLTATSTVTIRAKASIGSAYTVVGNASTSLIVRRIS